MMPYDVFKTKIADILRVSDSPLTWTEIRTKAGLPQLFPNNQWVHRLEQDIGLCRQRDQTGVIHWQLKETMKDVETPKASSKVTSRSGRKQDPME
jgi:hypothetical protein